MQTERAERRNQANTIERQTAASARHEAPTEPVRSALATAEHKGVGLGAIRHVVGHGSGGSGSGRRRGRCAKRMYIN